MFDNIKDAINITKRWWKPRREKMKTRVVHCNKEPYDVYIGRGGRWGNPFSIGVDGNREEVIEKYRQFVLQHPQMLEDLHKLKGKVLGCWCKPSVCHGDVLVELLEQDTMESMFKGEENVA